RQPVTPLGSALALHEPRVLEVEEDVLEELERDLLRLRDPVALDRTAVRGRGELRARPDRVVDLRRDPHCGPKRSPRRVCAWLGRAGGGARPAWKTIASSSPAPGRCGSCRRALPRRAPCRLPRPASRRPGGHP